MNTFEFYCPTRYVFGRESELRTAEMVKQHGGTKVLMIYGGGSAERSGLLNRIRNNLTCSKIKFLELGGVKPNPRKNLVYQGIELCRKEKIDFLLAIGGGSSIDTAKAIAIGTGYDGDFWDFYNGTKTVDSALPLGVVLTIAATGSESSSSSVILLEVGSTKFGCDSDLIRPKFAIMNPELLYTLPAYQTASGCVDIFSHVLERYFTNTQNVETTDRVCEALLMAVVNEAPKVMKDPCNYDARANIMWAGSQAHNNICGVGREHDWSCHCIEQLSGFYDCAHGAALAVVIPAWMRYVVDHDIERFSKYATRIFNCLDNGDKRACALEGIARTKAFFESLGMPVNLNQIGAKVSDINVLKEIAIYGPVGTLGNFVKLDHNDVENILKIASR